MAIQAAVFAIIVSTTRHTARQSITLPTAGSSPKASVRLQLVAACDVDRVFAASIPLLDQSATLHHASGRWRLHVNP